MQTGVDVTGVRDVGSNINFTSFAGGGSVWGYNADMTNATGAGTTYSGYHVQNLSTNTSNGMFIENMSAGNGISIGNMSGGVGINVGMASAPSIGINADASNGGGATALKVLGNGSGEPGTSVGIEVNNAQVRATGANPFSGRVAYVGGASPVTVTNSEVGIGSSIIVTFERDAVDNNIYNCSVQNVGTGSFQVNCSSAASGFIDYIIINH